MDRKQHIERVAYLLSVVLVLGTLGLPKRDHAPLGAVLWILMFHTGFALLLFSNVSSRTIRSLQHASFFLVLALLTPSPQTNTLHPRGIRPRTTLKNKIGDVNSNFQVINAQGDTRNYSMRIAPFKKCTADSELMMHDDTAPCESINGQQRRKGVSFDMEKLTHDGSHYQNTQNYRPGINGINIFPESYPCQTGTNAWYEYIQNFVQLAFNFPYAGFQSRRDGSYSGALLGLGGGWFDNVYGSCTGECSIRQQ